MYGELPRNNEVNVSIDLNKKTLDVATTSGYLFWSKTDTLSYSLEGWTGRYGMPLEFLLSLHLASEQPDLVIDILNTFETHVNVGLHKTDATFTAGLEISGQMVSLQDLLALGDSDTYYKKLYPSYYKQLQEERAAAAGESGEEGSEESGEEAGADSAYQEELDGVTGSLSPVGSGSDGEDLYEVPAGSQGANGASTVVISRDGTIYEVIRNDDGTLTYQKTDQQYEIVHEGDREYDITNEDEEVIPYEDAIAALTGAAGNTNGSYSFKTLLPYIRNVDEHWFRDVYFILGTDSKFREKDTEKLVRIIKNDTDYEYTVGERWTEYETETDAEGNKHFTLYQVNDDGSLGARYNGTQEQARKEDIRVSRKALTQLISEKEGFADEIGGNGISSNLWTAYKLVDGGEVISWAPWDDNQKDYPEGASELIKDKLKYKISVAQQIVQERDGERGETNASIKKMLTRYKYYSYDGSTDRAAKIDEDRKKYPDYQHEVNGTIIDGTEDDPRNQNLVTKFSINADSLSAFKILENMNTLDADEIYRDFKELIVELNYFDKEELSSRDPAQFQWILPDTGTIGWPVREFSKKEKYGTLIHSKVDLKNLYKIYETTVPTGGQGGGPSSPDENEDSEVSLVTDDTNITTIMGQLFLDQKESLESIQGKASNKMAEGGSGFSQGSFIDTAQACWDYLYSVGGSVSYGGMGACPFAQSPSSSSHKSTIDCSAWVTWVLYEWGTGEVKSHFSSQRATPTLMSDNYEDLFGWTEIPLSGNQDAKPLLQPGDIIVRDNGEGGAHGHTAIVKEVDGGTVKGWDCGSSSHWRGSENRTETTIGSGFVSGDGRKGKIIRVDDIIEIPAKKYEGYEGNTDVVSPVTGEIVEVGKVTIQNNVETNQTEEVGYIKLKAMTTEDYQAINPPKVNPKDISDLSKHDKEYAGFEYFYQDYKAAGVLGMYIYIEGFDVRIADEGPVFKDDSTVMEDGEYLSKYRKHTYEDVIGDETRKVLDNKEKLRNYAVSTFTLKVGGKEKLFIKEGTVLGKTYTDGDLEEFSDVSEVDKDRAVIRPCVKAKQEGETVEYPQMVFANGMSPVWEEIEEDDKPTGNYIRVILRTAEDGQANIETATEEASNNTDKDNIIEDIEDYLELDERIISDECPMKLQTTDIPEDEWVRLVVEYANNYGTAHDVFKDPDTMHKFYKLCVSYEMNPDFLFVRAICESSLHIDEGTGNYWGWAVPNGKEHVTKIADDGTMLSSLEVVCKGILNTYVTPGGKYYGSIISRYNERKGVTENGGIPRFGYGMPDTVPGVMSVYSWLGDNHDSAVRGILQEAGIYSDSAGYERLCGSVHGSGPTTVWEQGSYTASQVRKMLNIAHNVWPPYYPQTFENELWN